MINDICELLLLEPVNASIHEVVTDISNVEIISDVLGKIVVESDFGLGSTISQTPIIRIESTERPNVLEPIEDLTIQVVDIQNYCQQCNYSCTRNSDLKKHLSTKKHVEIINSKSLMSALKCSHFCCLKCEYFTISKSNLEKHFHTNKHLLQVTPQVVGMTIAPKYHCKMCDKHYKSKSGLWKHSHVCKAPGIIPETVNIVSHAKIDNLEKVIDKLTDLVKNQQRMMGSS